MQGGIFTACLALVRAAWKILGRILDLFSSLGGGLVYEILSLIIIYGIIFFGVPVIEFFIKIAKKLLHFWE